MNHGDPQKKGAWMSHGDRVSQPAHQLTPRLLGLERYIHDNRSGDGTDRDGDRDAVENLRCHGGVRAIQALGFAGLRDLKANAGAVVWSGGHPPAKRCPPR